MISQISTTGWFLNHDSNFRLACKELNFNIFFMFMGLRIIRYGNHICNKQDATFYALC